MVCNRPLATAAVMLLAPLTLRGQGIRGIAISIDSVPVAGVVISVLDSADNTVARALSNEGGEFRVRFAREGTYRLRAIRIGFRPVMSEPFHIAKDEEVYRRIVLTNIPLRLAAVSIEERSSCGPGGQSALATFTLLEQVRAALTAAQLTQAARGVSATTVSYTRTRAVRSLRLIDQAARVTTEFVRQPWRTISPETARRAGYVAVGQDGTTVYSGPGLDGLTSAGFIEDHCFRLVPGSTPDTLGISFVPTRARNRAKLPELQGTMWVGRGSAELKRLEFSYVNIPPVQARHASGHIEFARLSTGEWVITRWNLRLPSLQAAMATPRRSRVDTTVADLRDIGGELVLATRNGDTLWSAPPITAMGTALDSATGAAVTGAHIELVNTPHRARTDAQGRFALPDVLPGRYSARVRTPSLDSVGAQHEVPVEIADASDSLVLRIPSASQFLATVCAGRSRGGPLDGAIVGTVRMRQDTLVPVGNARVVVEWTTASRTAADTGEQSLPEPARLEVRSGASGAFRACGVPRGIPLIVRGETATGMYAEPVRVRVAPGIRVASVHLSIDSSVTGLADLEGAVVGGPRAVPLANVEVSLPTLDRYTATNADGRFQLSGIPPGAHRVRVRRLGYGPLDTTLTLSANRTFSRTIVLTRVTTIDSVNVIASEPNLPRSFVEHQRVGLGAFLTRDQLAKENGRKMGDVLRSLPGVLMLSGTAGRAWMATSRGVKSLGQPCAGEGLEGWTPLDGPKCACLAQVYLDGRLISKTETPDINRFSAEQLEAVEFYSGPAQIPDEYTGLNSQCGVLVLWTRRSP